MTESINLYTTRNGYELCLNREGNLFVVENSVTPPMFVYCNAHLLKRCTHPTTKSFLLMGAIFRTINTFTSFNEKFQEFMISPRFLEDIFRKVSEYLDIDLSFDFVGIQKKMCPLSYEGNDAEDELLTELLVESTTETECTPLLTATTGPILLSGRKAVCVIHMGLDEISICADEYPGIDTDRVEIIQIAAEELFNNWNAEDISTYYKEVLQVFLYSEGIWLSRTSCGFIDRRHRFKASYLKSYFPCNSGQALFNAVDAMVLKELSARAQLAWASCAECSERGK